MQQVIRCRTSCSLALSLLFLAVFVFILGSQVQAQTEGQSHELAVHPDGRVEVKTLPPAGPEALAKRVIPRRVPDPELLRQHKRRLKLDSMDSLPAQDVAPQSAPSPAPSIIRSFIGLRYSDSGFIPPDTNVAAGPQHIFEVVNLTGRILTKNGAVINTFSLHAFFGLPSAGIIVADPRVRFDPMSGRWFVALITGETTFGTWRLAVSMNDNPTGTFVRYTVPLAGNLPDYPAMGINDDKVILSANAFACMTSCTDVGGFIGTEFVVFNKAQLLAGGAVSSQVFGPPQGLFTIQPAHSLSSSSTLFMAAVDFPSATSVRIWSVVGIPGIGPGVTLMTADRPILSLSSPPDAEQKGTSVVIETNDNSLLDAVFRNDSLWLTANAACVPSGDTATRACLRFIQVLTGSLVIGQDFIFGMPGIHHYYAAIQTDRANNLIAVFSRSSVSEFASVYVSGRLATDPPNTLQAPVVLKAGEAPYTPLPSRRRWGDYSGAGIDPINPMTVWVAGEYARVEGGSEWGTWIAQVQVEQLIDVVYVLGTDRKLWREQGNASDRDLVDANVLAFQALDQTVVYVLGTDGKLWREWGNWQDRDFVDANVLAFQALDQTVVYVLGTDGKLWRERGNWQDRDFVDANVLAFQGLDM